MDTGTARVPAKTMGGRFLWKNTASFNGWRIQQNKITGQIRILDSEDMLIAVGTKLKMTEAIQRMTDYVNENRNLEHAKADNVLEKVSKQRKKLRLSLDTGKITQKEFERRSKPLEEKIRYLIGVSMYEEWFDNYRPRSADMDYFISRLHDFRKAVSRSEKISAVQGLVASGLSIIISAPSSVKGIMDRRDLSPAVQILSSFLILLASAFSYGGIFLLLNWLLH